MEVQGLVMEEEVGGGTVNTADKTNGATRIAKNAADFGGNYYINLASWPGSWTYLNYDCIRGGGLLIIYSNSLDGNGIISSIGGTSYAYDPTDGYYGGSCGGGGSINIFVNEDITSENLNISSLGGKVTQNNTNGGDGCSTVGVISGGTFLKK